MDNSLLAVRDINHKYIVVEEGTFFNTERKGWKKDEENKNVYGSRSVYESFDIIRM